MERAVVSYRNSTSNHNKGATTAPNGGLYLIEILHQTTTVRRSAWTTFGCILSKFYIKPQRNPLHQIRVFRCILSKFYIKPQRRDRDFSCQNVVSYRNSTSNHNDVTPPSSISTLYLIEILHQTTTKSPPYARTLLLYLIEILHQTTTVRPLCTLYRRCILSKFYIKPQQAGAKALRGPRCILSKFYIKPQLAIRVVKNRRCCILSKFYIKPQRSGAVPQLQRCCILSKFYIKPQLRTTP